jgi:predicted RecA/RadA family phage recombinase
MERKLLNTLIVGALIYTMVFAVHAATNFVQDGDVVTLTWATTSPAKNAPVVKGASKAAGAITGVALNGTSTPAERVNVKTSGVFNLPVTSAIATISVGDYVFASMAADREVCTTVLSDTNTGVVFGQLLELVASGSTATVKVRLMQSAD